MKKRILSGMRPTGKLHLGHLVGALKNWIQLQDKYECLFMVADWHALMSEYKEPSRLKEFSVDNVIDWISCGIDPDKSVLFIQSHIPEHLELGMIFSCMTPLGWLERCPTYKEQLRELTTREINTYAFLGYPVLQAADILLYKSEIVPVGEDQLPHLELTRQIAGRFNNLMKKQIFPEPQAELTNVPRLMGTDGRKMSKSYNNYIGLSDSSLEVNKKVISMFTDPSRIRKTDVGHPDVCNVYNYYQVFASGEIGSCVKEQCLRAKIGCTDCKKQLGEILNDYLAPIQSRRARLVEEKEKILGILEAGIDRAKLIASATIKEVKQTIGL